LPPYAGWSMGGPAPSLSGSLSPKAINISVVDCLSPGRRLDWLWRIYDCLDYVRGLCSPPHPNPHPNPFSLTIFRRWPFRVWLPRRGSPATTPELAFILTGSLGNSLSPGLISPTGAGGYSFTAIAGSAAGGCGFTTTISVVGIAYGGAGSGIGTRATLDRGSRGCGRVFPPLRRPGYIRGPTGFWIVGGGWRRRCGGRSLLSG
jgi:hypothetical protein